MSANRTRKSGMRRAYLKKTSARFNSDGYAQAGIQFSLKPSIPLPNRKQLTKHSPTMTEPMKARVESWRIAVKDQRNEYSVTLVDTPINLIRMFFTGFDARAIYWFKWLDRLSGTERESFTYGSKVKAMDHFTKWSIPWKE